ncbi:Sensor histidine kinase RcsC [Emticicia aquatica]|uniref:histidine kinase n=1 Tax=Emticicia aquatica TaxID=1681835 RepID=A0ABN8EMW7_9BACT|nr:PAS domain S-box protein [Emticicia aquatica]CAH0993900.1 Sensor histidine kinase RcsC [Emticicia aquatica]
MKNFTTSLLNNRAKFIKKFSLLIHCLGIKSSKDFITDCETLKANVKDLFMVVDTNGNILYVKENIQKLLGHNINVFSKLYLFRTYSSFIAEIFRKAINENEWTYPYIEFPFKNSNGQYIWIRVSFSLTKIHDALFIIATAKDVSIKRNTFNQLELTHSWSKILIENLKEGIIMEDQNRRLLITNKALLDIFDMNLDPINLVGADCENVAQQLKNVFISSEEFIEKIHLNIVNKTNVIAEILKMKNGKILERDYYPILNSNGQYSHIWKYRDITQEFTVTERIMQSEEKYRGIIENMELGILEVDNNDTIVNAYEKFCKMVGYEKEELIGQKAHDVFLSKEYFHSFSETQKKRESGESSTYELPLLKKDGSIVWMLISGTPVIEFNGKSIGSIGIHYDITERKRLEEDLRLANRIAIEAKESEQLFLANMTHELKTPINAIVGMGDLLKLSKLDTEQKDYVEVLDTSTKFLQKLVSDILDTSKIETGNVYIKNEIFDLNKLLYNVTQVFEYSLLKKNVKLEYDFDCQKVLLLSGDSMLMQQIITNLLSNAEKFTNEGKVVLSVKTTELDTKKIKVKISVQDTGIGFDNSQKEIIFDKFKQLPSVNMHKSQGTGLGLSIVKKLIELQGGEIQVESLVGKGSTFSFELIFEKVIPSKNQVEVFNKFSNAVSLRNIKILVIEDNELNQQYIERVLNKWSVQFEMAKSGEEGIVKFANNHFDLVLLDLQLPGIDGFQTATRLRIDNQEKFFVIIAMTAVVSPNIERDVLKFGMDDIVKKPFTINELHDKITYYFPEDNKSDVSHETIPFFGELDASFLAKFYGNDKNYAIEVFDTFQQRYFTDFKKILKTIDETPIIEAKKKLHSIKPSFRMVGLTMVEDEIDKFLKQKKNDTDKFKNHFSEEELDNMQRKIAIQINMLK